VLFISFSPVQAPHVYQVFLFAFLVVWGFVFRNIPRQMKIYT